MRAMRMRGVLATLAVVMAACSADGGGTDTGARTDGGDGGAHRDTGPSIDTGDPTQREIVSVIISPSNPTLTSTDGSMPAQVFQAIGTRRDGTTTTLTSGTWATADIVLGTISSSGTFTANGIAAGNTQVSVDVPGPAGGTLHATTTLTVTVARTITVTGAETGAAHFTAGLPAADPANEAGVVYPLDTAVMPNNVSPPDIQWTNSAAGDQFRVRITKPDVSITAYVADTGAGFNHDWLVTSGIWHTVAESDPNDPAVITVDRWISASGELVAGTPVHVTLAHGGIFGAVYYWDLSAGHLFRIDAVTGQQQDFMPTPPPNPADGTNHCVACHTVSREGRYLSAELWGGGQNSTVFDLTSDLTTNPAPTVFDPATQTWLFSSFNADSSRLVINNGNALSLIDPRNGASVASSGLPGAGAAHPSWSADNSSIAYIANTDGSWAVDFTNGDLALLNTGGGDAFTGPSVIHSGASFAGQPEGGNVDSHPSWSPDSQWIAFAHGTNSRTGNGAAQYPGALYLIPRAGGNALRLNNAVGGSPSSYWPTFSPFVTTEPNGHHYIWVAFISRRPYGNALAGTGTSTRRQIWVAALDETAAASGADPSLVPYWLPGQSAAVENMAAQWATVACRTNGAVCGVSSECCSGSCLTDPTNPTQTTCQTPTSMCRTAGMTCGGNGDCCTGSGLMCVSNVCTVPPG